MRRNRLFVLLAFLLVALPSCTLREIPSLQPVPSGPPLPRQAKIALVLGAGASKGFAHVGVLKILEANKIPIDMIVGTSVGSFVGSLYAYRRDAFYLQKLSFSVEMKDLIDLTLPENGFIKGDKLEEFVNKTLKNSLMEQLTIPFYAVATDIQSGQEIVFGKGNTAAAVRASCSIPGVFKPKKIGDRLYVDGGVVSPVAVDAARRVGADVVIAVDLSSGVESQLPQNTIETLLQSINIMYSKLSSIQLSRADVVIRPKVGHIASGDFSRRHETILEGERAALENLPRLLEILSQLRAEGRLE